MLCKSAMVFFRQQFKSFNSNNEFLLCLQCSLSKMCDPQKEKLCVL